jgi:hypothetical protein
MIPVCRTYISKGVQRRDDEETVAQTQCDRCRSRNADAMKKETQCHKLDEGRWKTSEDNDIHSRAEHRQDYTFLAAWYIARPMHVET